MVHRFARVLATSAVLACAGLPLAGCKREEAPPQPTALEEHLTRHPSIDLMHNGVALHLTLPGWSIMGRDDDADVNVYAYENRRLLIQLRRFKRTDDKSVPEEAAADALQAFCPKAPCKIGAIKPGYWLSHYDSDQDGAPVLNWDLASFPEPGVMALAIIKVFGADDATHKAIEKALKESLTLTLTEK